MQPNKNKIEINNHWLDHLTLLRRYLIQYLLLLFICFAVAFYFNASLYHWFAKPLLDQLPANGKLIATEITSPLLIPIKLASIIALLASVPFFFWQLWRFIMPALLPFEKKWLLFFVGMSSCLFCLGISFCYFIISPMMLKFFIHFAPNQVTIMADISSYLSFMLQLLFSFGLLFQIPMLMIVGVFSGLIHYIQLKNFRRYVIVLAFIAAILIGPPDILSQLFIAVPVWVLYELGMVVIYLTFVVGKTNLDLKKHAN